MPVHGRVLRLAVGMLATHSRIPHRVGGVRLRPALLEGRACGPVLGWQAQTCCVRPACSNLEFVIYSSGDALALSKAVECASLGLCVVTCAKTSGLH